LSVSDAKAGNPGDNGRADDRPRGGRRAGRGAKGPPQSARLVELACGGGTGLWHTPQQKAYATVLVKAHREHWPVRSTPFRRWLAQKFFLLEGHPPSSGPLEEALGVLEGQALFAGREHPAFVRVAGHEGSVYLDLGDPYWRAVEIDAGGWALTDSPPVRFRRPRGLLALPEPVRGGSLDDLRPFVNLGGGDADDADDAAWRLLVCWLAAAVRPAGPYPLLALTGEQGTAKTTLGKLLRSLVDPSAAPLRSEPREVRDLMIAATSGWLVALDNVSYLPQWLSDALCRLATGGGFATRALYTDEEETLFDAQRPGLLNGIEDVVTSGDLLDRTLPLRLEPIAEEDRRTEADLWARWEAVRPGVLGALLDAVSGGLRLLPSLCLPRLPRMADFALWGEAVGRGLGWPRGAFLDAYQAAIGDAAHATLEASLVAGPLQLLMAVRDSWEGTASDLLKELAGVAGDKAKAKGWPSRPGQLGGHLRRLAPGLRRVGLWVRFERGPRARTITIERRGAASSSASSSSPGPGKPAGGVTPDDAARDAHDAGDDATRDPGNHGFSEVVTQDDDDDAPARQGSGCNPDGSWGPGVETPFD
jgi:hypothetical protein